MQQNTLFLLLTAYLAILSSSQIVCPPGLYDDAAGFCKACILDPDTCGSNPSCPQVYQAKDSTGADAGCTPVPTCEAGQFFNKEGANPDQQICKPCQEASDLICATNVCSGYFYNTDPQINACQPLPDCSIGTYYISQACSDCQGALIDDSNRAICGVKSGCLGFFIKTVDIDGTQTEICSSCSLVQNADPSGTPVDNKYCTCLEGYYWDATTFSCLDCAQSTEGATCKLCKNHVFNQVSSACEACSMLDNTNSTYNSVSGGCNCQAGFTWSTTADNQNRCLPCQSATTADFCKAETCAGYYFDQNIESGKCTLCSSVLETNSSINDLAYGLTSCVCNLDKSWSSILDGAPAPGFCDSCQVATVDTCVPLSCPNWLWDGNACTDQCTAESAGNGAIAGLVQNGECLCNIGSFWSSTDRKCMECNVATDEAVCKSGNCDGFLWFQNGVCGDCSAVANHDAAITPAITVDGVCACLPKFKWNATTYKCDSCSAVSISECAVDTCSDYFISGSTCRLCPSTADPRTPSTPFTQCECKPGSIWSNRTNTCVVCDSTTSALNVLTNICVLCDSQPTNNLDGPNDAYSCKCKKGYVWFNGTCGCNATKLEFDKGSGAGCATCNLFPGGTSYNNVTKGCNCVNGAVWNTVLKKCRCTSTTSFLFNNVCTLCTTLGKGVTTGGSSLNPDQCTCAANWVWNTTFKTCICSEATSIYNKNATVSICEKCNKLTFYSNGSRATPFSCFCRTGMVWDTKTRSCICDAFSVPSASKSACTSCKSLPGSTGTKASSVSCNCTTGWVWSSTLRNCICSSTACSCPSGFVLNNSRICVSCSSVVGASGLVASRTSCQCLKSYVWNSATFKCDCPKGAFTNGAKTYCRYCDVFSNSNGKFATAANTSCACLPNHKWNTATQQCDFNPASVSIYLLNGTLISCKNLPTSTGVALDNFNCKCQTNFVWNDYTNACVACSTISNSTGKTTSAYACGCNPNFYWDFLSFSCKQTSCKYPITDTRCTSCPKHAGNVLTAQLLIVTATEKTILLSGDSNFAAAAKTASAQYLNYTSYKCLCATNYTWSVARRRCYFRTLNATA